MKIIIYMLMICFAITGCSVGKKENPNEKPEQKNVSMRNVSYTNKSNKPNEKGRSFGFFSFNIPGVNDATAVVLENMLL